MLPQEVTKVLKALRGHGINVVSIHNHMISTQPGDHLPALLGAGHCGRSGRCVQSGASINWGNNEMQK